jgi:hypothetical protein
MLDPKAHGMIHKRENEADYERMSPMREKVQLLQRMTGEAREHMINCTAAEKKKDLSYLAGTCRGCPANCFEKGEFGNKE